MSRKVKEVEVDANFEPKVVGRNKSVPIDSIRANAYNYNRQSKFIYEKLKKIIQKRGFADPLKVRSGNEHGDFGYYEVINGEHRLRAARELGYTELPIRDLGCVPDVEAKGQCIESNETTGKPDNELLAALIADMKSSGDEAALETLPYSDAEIEAFVGMHTEEDLITDVDALGDEIDEDEDVRDGAERKQTFVEALGILSMDREEERNLLKRWKKILIALDLQERPLSAFKKMLRDARDTYCE